MNSEDSKRSRRSKVVILPEIVNPASIYATNARGFKS